MTLQQIDQWLNQTRNWKDTEYDKAIHESVVIEQLKHELSDEEE